MKASGEEASVLTARLDAGEAALTREGSYDSYSVTAYQRGPSRGAISSREHRRAVSSYDKGNQREIEPLL